MDTRVFVAIAGALLSLSIPLNAAPPTVSIVNGTGSDITSISYRRVGGSGWAALGLAVPSGKLASAPFSSPDCAFDLKVALSTGQELTFSAVNLCDAKLLTLRRTGTNAWVDYD